MTDPLPSWAQRYLGGGTAPSPAPPSSPPRNDLPAWAQRYLSPRLPEEEKTKKRSPLLERPAWAANAPTAEEVESALPGFVESMARGSVEDLAAGAKALGRGVMSVRGAAGAALESAGAGAPGVLGEVISDLGKSIRRTSTVPETDLLVSDETGDVFTQLGQDPGRALLVATGENLPNLAATAAATVVAGPLGGLAASGVLEGGGAYEQAVEGGATEDEANRAALATAIVNAPLDYLPVGRLFSKLQGGTELGVKKLIASIGSQAALEGGTEAVQELNTKLIALATHAGEQGLTLPDLEAVITPENLRQYGNAGVIGVFLGGGGSLATESQGRSTRDLEAAPPEGLNNQPEGIVPEEPEGAAVIPAQDELLATELEEPELTDAQIRIANKEDQRLLRRRLEDRVFGAVLQPPPEGMPERRLTDRRRVIYAPPTQGAAPETPVGAPLLEQEPRSPEIPTSPLPQERSGLEANPDLQEGAFFEPPVQPGATEGGFIGPAQAAQAPVTFRPEIEEKVQAAKLGVRQPKFTERVVGAYRHLTQGLSREFRDLPRGEARWVPMRESLRILGHAPQVSAETVAERMKGVLGNLADADYDLFLKKRLVDDARAIRSAYPPETPLPMGLTDADLTETGPALDVAVAQNPRVTEALFRDREMWREAREKLTAAYELVGEDASFLQTRGDAYLHHQVMELATVMQTAMRRKFGKLKGRGWQKKLEGSERSINLAYAQAQLQVLTQMHMDAEIARQRAATKASYDIKPTLVEQHGRDGWRANIPEGYSTYSLEPGRIFFTGSSLTERVARRVIEEGLTEIAPEDIKQALMVGGARGEMVLPNEVVSTLRQQEKAIDDSFKQAVWKANEALVKGWKVWQLLMPRRAFKYVSRNLVGDATKVLAGNPHAFTKIKRSASELADVIYGREKPSDTLQGYMLRGGFQSTLWQQELSGGEKERLRRLVKDPHPVKAIGELGKDFASVPRRYFDWAKRQVLFAESVQRYATYLDYLESMQGNPEGIPKNWGASIPEEIMALPEIEDRAFWLSNELIGAYDQISVAGQFLRQEIAPFWCVPTETEILTRDGWKTYDEVQIGEEVMTFDCASKLTEWQPVQDVAVFPFDGELNTIHSSKGGFELSWTDEHRLVVYELYPDRYKIVPASELKTHHHLAVVGDHRFPEEESILGVKDSALLGWVVTDGYFRWRRRRPHEQESCEMMVYQSPKKHAALIREQFAEYISSESVHPQTGVICFRLKAAEMKRILAVFQNKADLPRIVTRLSKEACEAMMDAMFLAEGNYAGPIDRKERARAFAQAPGPVMDAFQILAYRLGIAGHIRPKATGLGKPGALLYLKKRRLIQTQKWSKLKTPYAGLVWCPQTPNGTWVMRQNGIVCITGNSFQELNIRSNYRLIRNAVRNEKVAHRIGTKALGVMAARVGIPATIRVGKFLGLAYALEGVLYAVNNLFFPDEEEDLPAEVKKNAHIILGRNEDGTVRYFNRLSPLEEAREWFGLDEFSPASVQDYLNGRKTALEAAKNMAWAPVEKTINSIGPLSGFGIKQLMEMVTGVSTFPSARTPRPIQDRADYLARSFGLEHEYRTLALKPDPSGGRNSTPESRYLRTLSDVFLYTAEPEASAYYDTLTLKRQWLEQTTGDASNRGVSYSAKSESLRQYKRALRYGQKDLTMVWLMDYAAKGGTAEGMQQSLERMDPLYSLDEGEETAFREWLGEDEELLDKALKYYQAVFAEGEEEMNSPEVEKVFEEAEAAKEAVQ